MCRVFSIECSFVMHVGSSRTTWVSLDDRNPKVSDSCKMYLVCGSFWFLASGALQAPWGQDDAFFPLHNKCFLERFGEYDYNLCFFKSVDQLSVKSKTERNALGTTWTWNATMRAGVFSEGKQCHAGPKRSTAVVFECGTEDKLVAVAEKQKCVYEARFLTPAACWT
eukprot:m.283595 g.283595  ORF g.283595 m.283595 type:complete len:167 (-) comp19880_c0_seq16:262-762(-)